MSKFFSTAKLKLPTHHVVKIYNQLLGEDYYYLWEKYISIRASRNVCACVWVCVLERERGYFAWPCEKWKIRREREREREWEKGHISIKMLFISGKNDPRSFLTDGRSVTGLPFNLFETVCLKWNGFTLWSLFGLLSFVIICPYWDFL